MVAIGFQLAVEMSRHFNTAVRWTAEYESNMTSTQRLLSYVNLKPEKPLNSLLSSVNIQGNISFKEVEMKYDDNLRPALKNLSFDIKEGDKVAIVGRTGSGKSSIF